MADRGLERFPLWAGPAERIPVADERTFSSGQIRVEVVCLRGDDPGAARWLRRTEVLAIYWMTVAAVIRRAR